MVAKVLPVEPSVAKADSHPDRVGDSWGNDGAYRALRRQGFEGRRLQPVPAGLGVITLRGLQGCLQNEIFRLFGPDEYDAWPLGLNEPPGEDQGVRPILAGYLFGQVPVLLLFCGGSVGPRWAQGLQTPGWSVRRQDAPQHRGRGRLEPAAPVHKTP